MSSTDLSLLGIPGFVNLDYAATAPCLKAAADAVNELLPWYGSIHRGAGALSQRCTREYEQARQTIGDFVGARAEDHVIFTRNTTDALNLLAHCLPRGTTVITFGGEHHANLLPWHYPVRLPVPSSPGEAIRSLGQALAVNFQTDVLVSVTGASNVTGEIWPIAELAQIAHRHGARIAVDAAQLAPHVPIDLSALGIDYLALSGHKLYAPFGTGVLVGRSDWLDAAVPLTKGGGATARVGDATHDVRWATGPARHEAGTPNLLGAVALAKVCATLDAADRQALFDREQRLLARLREGLSEIAGLEELRMFGRDARRIGVVSFAVKGRDSAQIAEILGQKYQIGVRDGLFCAHPLARRLLGEASVRAGWEGVPATALRASIGLGTTEADVDALIHALAAELNAPHDALLLESALSR
ncbi:cysteine desulfurase [Rhizocola hellebori]|uniref:Cysteine desulfurase n=1 Tax=Rhizocola hellebori TaxID=1392758 RepID=A0A8J3QFZ3_9ACTN|nr:aminotransferase class V-fold PLP-dependent enzyme [Rhizocola hellebori]GIH10263.1 cysteine desulfurase [Rhizocola hellebori]